MRAIVGLWMTNLPGFIPRHHRGHSTTLSSPESGAELGALRGSGSGRAAGLPMDINTFSGVAPTCGGRRREEHRIRAIMSPTEGPSANASKLPGGPFGRSGEWPPTIWLCF